MQKDPDGAPFVGLVDLACKDVGGEALSCGDDFFAGMERLLLPERAVFLPDEYTDRGKWMDGWESRRKRAAWGVGAAMAVVIAAEGYPGRRARGIRSAGSRRRRATPRCCTQAPDAPRPASCRAAAGA